VIRPRAPAGAALAALAALLVWATAATAAPPAAGAQSPPLPGARAAILVDSSDGAVLFARRPDQRRAIASATKLMTALLALERARPGAVFRAPPRHPLPPESRIDLRGGERMTVRDLLKGLLLESANDAAVTLAQGISGSRAAFVAAMNRRAARLGLRHTRYANPIGLDAPGNYSTARDLARLSGRLMRDRRFAAIVDMPSARLRSGDRPRVIQNRNTLVARYRFVDGIKTGHTLQAGYVLVGAARGGDGKRLTSVVLGEPSEPARDADTLRLLRYGLTEFRRRVAVRRGRVLARVRVAGRDERAALVAPRSLTLTVRRGRRVVRRLDAPAELEGSLPAGRRVGTVTVLVDGRPAARAALVTAAAVPGARPLGALLDAVGVPLVVLVGAGTLAVAGLVAMRRGRTRLARAGRRSGGSRAG
jgi:D-alanyl-D-alanine carboxypeptidase (penicillin-binding protein 5/6)